MRSRDVEGLRLKSFAAHAHAVRPRRHIEREATITPGDPRDVIDRNRNAGQRLTIGRDADAVASGLVLAARYDRRVMVQRFVAGTEITVGVLATPDVEVLPTLEITYENDTYDYDAKYTAGKSHHIIPARLTPAAQQAAREAAARAFDVLGCEGMARVDMIVDPSGTPWLLEVNTVPGLTELSLFPDAARAAGIEFPEVCERLLRHALERHARRLGA